MSATIGRDHVIDLAVGNRRPNTVHFNFVVIANDATLGRPTIHQIAARTSVVSSELRVEALMPFIVARPVVSLLRRSVHTKKKKAAPPRSVMNSRRLKPDMELPPRFVPTKRTQRITEQTAGPWVTPEMFCIGLERSHTTVGLAWYAFRSADPQLGGDQHGSF